jgi:hypothetical protein
LSVFPARHRCYDAHPIKHIEEATLAKRARKRRAWASVDVKALKNSAKQLVRASQIARLLKRTEGAIRQKALALGISLNSQRRGKKKRSGAKKKK